MGLKKCPVEVAVAYDGASVSDASICKARSEGHHRTVPPEALLHGILIARPGVGFPGPLHLERFASPARLAVTDNPRLAYVGGIGMLSLVMPPSQLAHCSRHRHGYTSSSAQCPNPTVWTRPPLRLRT